jgi:hypothetical protein
VASPDRRFSPELVAAAGAVALGTGLRFFRLGFQSLWFDELYSVVFAAPTKSFAAIAATWAHDHPLGYPVMLHLWLRLLGDGEVAARSLSALWGVIGIAAMAFAGRRIGGARLGVVAALVTAVNAFHIAYSQEARAYTSVFVFAALACVFLVALVERRDLRSALGWGIAVGLAANLHYWALVMALGQGAAAAIVLGLERPGRRAWGALVLAGATAGLLVAPGLGRLIRAAEIKTYWAAPPKPLFFADFFHAWFGKSLPMSLLLVALLAALPLLLRRRPGADDDTVGTERHAATMLGLSVVIALGVAYLRSVLVVPMLVDRFTFVLLPAVLLLVAIALSRLRPAVLRVAAIVVVIALSLANLALTEYYTKPRKEQWREATSWVVRHPGFDADADVVLAIYAPGFQYYADRLAPGVLVSEATTAAVERATAATPPPGAVWIATARGVELPEEARRVLRERYRCTDRAAFIATRAERWERRPAPGQAPQQLRRRGSVSEFCEPRPSGPRGLDGRAARRRAAGTVARGEPGELRPCRRRERRPASWPGHLLRGAPPGGARLDIVREAWRT